MRAQPPGLARLGDLEEGLAVDNRVEDLDAWTPAPATDLVEHLRGPRPDVSVSQRLLRA